ncbi:MAG: TolC family protein [Bacteroidota bacterium]
MTLKNLLYIIVPLICSNGFAQKAWTLDECVAYAIDHNLQLNELLFTEQANKETYQQSKRSLLPTINGFSDYGISYGRQTNPNDNSIVNTDFFSNNYSISASFDIFQGFQKINGIKAARYIYNAAKEERLQQKYLLAFRVMAAYYDIQFIQGLISISKEQVTISQRNYDLVKQQIELGLTAGADLYEAEALLFADKLALTQNENRLIAAKLTLLQEMNISHEDDIIVAPELKNLTIENARKESVAADSVFDLAKDFIPLIKAQELRVKAAKKQVAVARGDLYPSLLIQGRVATGYYETITDSLDMTIPFRTQFRDNTNEFIGVSLNVPLSNAWSNRSRVKQQKIALDRAKNTAKVQEQELYQLIQQLVQQNNALRAEVQQTEKQVKSQELAFSIAQKRYEKGLVNAIELGQAKTLFATAQNQNLQAQLQLRVNKSTLDFYKGLPVFNIN